MLFNIEADAGTYVVAYLVLDDFSAVPRLLVRGGGGEREVQANELRDALVSAGRHETGRCGFRLDAREIPEIAASDLELREARSGVLVYRRKQPDAIEAKILRLETGLLPLWRFDDQLAPRFHYAMTRIENYGRETDTQMFLMNQVTSQYLSGRIIYKNFEYFIGNAFKVWICVQKPYEELAERLLILKRVRHVGIELLSERDRISLRAAIDFAEHLPLDDPKAMKRMLRDMPDEIAAKLSNPLTRQLTASDPDEMPASGAVASALDVLAGCQLVGFRHAFDAFADSAARLLDLPPFENAGAGGSFSVIHQVAAVLEDSAAVERILEKDLELFYYLTQAARNADAKEDA